ncbi:MsnO8 family LLM class oxidoreductase, partial [Paracoccus sp. PXZ]
VAAHPGEGTNVPVWILGSSLYGASLAAALGLPYAFASHFAPGDLDQAAQLYRNRFEPTEFGEKPRFMLAVNVIAAETDAEAQRLRSSQQISFARLRLGMPGLLPPPVDDVLEAIPVRILPTVNAALAISAVGNPETVATELDRLIARYQPDELILVGNIHDQAARHRSFAIAAEILRGHA